MTDGPFEVVIRPSTEFTEENGTHKMSILKIASLPLRPAQVDPTSPQFLQWLSSIVNLDDRQMLRACGSLISFLQQHELEFGLDVSETALCIANIRIIPLSVRVFVFLSSSRRTGFLMVDYASLKALNIFATEMHPRFECSGRHEKIGFV